MITPTSGLIAGWRASGAGARPTSRSCAARRPARRRRRGRSRIRIVSRCGEPFFRQTIASRRTAMFESFDASSCSSAAHAVHVAGMVAREPLERDQRRAARGRALVLRGRGAAARASAGSGTARSRGRPGAHRGSRRCARLTRARPPTAAQRRERLLVARGRQLVGVRRRLGERHPIDEAERGPGPT